MSKYNNKFSPQTSPHHNDLSDNSLSNQWQLHDNRLNFLQQSLTKIQKKLIKLQKTIILISESSSELKDQFKSKLNEMISIVSQPQIINEQNLVTNDQFNYLMIDVRNLNQNQSEWIFKCQNLQRQLNKLSQKTLSDLKLNDIQDYINDRVALAEQKNKKFIQDKISDISKNLSNNLQKSISFTKHQQFFSTLSNNSNNNCIISPQQSNSHLHNSSVSKASSSQQQNALSSSHSQNKLLSNSRSSRGLDFVDPVRENMAGKRLNFMDGQQQQVRCLDQRGQKQKYSQQKSVPATSQNNNNSRVVYLREKLKQFEEINKKYEKKQSEYDSKQKAISSNNNNNKPTQNSRNIPTTKHPTSLYTSKTNNKNYRQIVSQDIYSSSSQQQHLKTISRQVHKDFQQPPSSYRQNSSSKKNYSNLSSTKTHAPNNNQNSEKKIDKLKSIKDYLEQTQSEIQESFLEPNYDRNHL